MLIISCIFFRPTICFLNNCLFLLLRKMINCVMCALLNNYVVLHKSSIIFTWKSNVSSQLKTNTNLPSWLPRAFTDSVFPVPAGPVNRVKVLLYTILYLIPDINYENETKVSCRVTENFSR